MLLNACTKKRVVENCYVVEVNSSFYWFLFKWVKGDLSIQNIQTNPTDPLPVNRRGHGQVPGETSKSLVM